MIARYSMTYDDRIDNRVNVEMDEDGPWVRWHDLRTHIDIAISRLNHDNIDGAQEVLRKIVNRERD